MIMPSQVHRQINKQVKATVWMANDYPLKLRHIMPALEILSVRVRTKTPSTRNHRFLKTPDLLPLVARKDALCQ